MRIINKIISVIIIIMILAGNFTILGTELISYAVSNTAVNNIEFSANFIDENGDKINKIYQSSRDTSLKLCLSIAVKNEGYFNGAIELKNSNFKIKDTILSDAIASIEGNTINLKQISNGETVNIELEVELLEQDSISVDMLTKTSTLNLTGTYVQEEANEVKVDISKEVTLNIVLDKEAHVELETKIITNKVLEVNGENKRVVQILIKSRLTNNEYPVKQTMIDVTTPTLNEQKPEKIEVLSLGTQATNGENSKVLSNAVKDDGDVQIIVNNEPDANNEIKWNKDKYDTFVITYIYSQNTNITENANETENTNITENANTAENTNSIEMQSVNVETQPKTAETETTSTNIQQQTNIETETNSIEKQETNTNPNMIEIETISTITLYSPTEQILTARSTNRNLNQELDNIVMINENASVEEIYKGQLYANINATNKKDIEYEKTTTLYVTSANILEQINIVEGSENFVTNTEEFFANSKFIQTKINKQKMLEILGEEGRITIEANGEYQVIDQNTEADKEGNIVITYNTPATEIKITTTEPKTAGILEFIHTKAIGENNYTREQLKSINSMKSTVTVQGMQNNQITSENSKDSSIKLNETITKAELTVDKDNLSTMQENDVSLGIKLITESEQYDLYKNPVIKIKLPDAVESVQLKNADKLYAEGFTIKIQYDTVQKIIILTLIGEQTEYPTVSATQIYLQLDLSIKLSKIAPKTTSKIIMEYTNENATNYYNTGAEGSETANAGIVEQSIGISSPSGLLKIYDVDVDENSKIEVPNSSNNNTESNQESEIEENATIRIPKQATEEQIKFNIALVNNTDENLKNVRIFGTIPTSENSIEGKVNTFATELTGITAENAIIYYTQNENATADVSKAENGWTTELSTLKNVKLFLIVLTELEKESNYLMSYTIKLPPEIAGDLESSTQYKVIYDTETNTDIESTSRKITFVTPTEIKMNATLQAEVGENTLKTGDTVKTGEVIKYTVSVTNNSSQTLNNVVLKGTVPEGAVLVEPEADYAYTESSYYVERPEITQKEINIPSLKVNETYIMQYEVRVKQGTTADITSNAIATCEETSVETNTITNKVEPSNIRVTIKRMVDQTFDLAAGELMQYFAYVENLSDTAIQNVKMELKLYNVEITEIYYNGETISADNIVFDEIPAKSSVGIEIYGNITDESNEISAVANVIYNNETYRSNKSIDKLLNTDAKITMTSPQDNAYIQENDTVEYYITVENLGEKESVIEIRDEIPQYLQIVEIDENGTPILQTTNPDNAETYVEEIANSISHRVTVPIQGKAEIKIITKVKPITESFDTKTITNQATAYVHEFKKSVSEEVVHILKGATIEDIKNIITGVAWLDENYNGEKDDDEKLLNEITVRLYDVSKDDYVRNETKNIIEAVTNENGEYEFEKIPDGEYIVLFEYDTEKYEPTIYQKNDVTTSKNSKAILKNITINGEEMLYAVTDTLKVQGNVTNINIGLREKHIFDLELNKFISKITVQNDRGVKTYNYDSSTFEKVEIAAKQLSKTNVILEYTIDVKNTGEISGYINTIVDYLPNGLTFSSELNPDWYLADGKLYTNQLMNYKLEPGEEKEVKIIFTKTMTNDNVGLINNRAEIYEAYNDYGINDIDSIANNALNEEDDIGSADVYIAIKTGGETIIMTIAYIILAAINIGLILFAVRTIRRKY